jgi:dihydrofolate reductase
MRKVVYGGACSLDGFLTDRNGAVDWLCFTQDAQAVMAESWAAMDTVLMGRKTWEVASAQSGDGGAMPGISSYVFSRTLEQIPGATLVSSDAGEFVRALKQQPGKDIVVMGGGVLARSLFEADVIDEVGLNIHPVLLGSGTPTFLDPGTRVALELVECRAMQAGCVLVRYRVNHR